MTLARLLLVTLAIESLAVVAAPGDAGPVAPPDPSQRIAAARAPGPFDVERVLERDGLRDGPRYKGATIYHPVRKVEVDGVESPEPPTRSAGVVLVPGYMGPERSMSRWGPFLASHGYVVMTIGTNGPGDNPDTRGAALVDGVVTLRAENERADSPLFGRLDPDRIAVGGWSMGGGGAQVAATLDPSIKAVLALCPWKPRPHVTHDVPVFFLGAERDRPAPVARHALPHFERLDEDTPKLLYEVRDARHNLAMDPRYADGDVGRFVIAWLKVFVDGDESWLPVIRSRPDSASRFRLEAMPEVDSPPVADAVPEKKAA
ncbi:MAG: triacylglycerol lipase [Planctomycetaceae bacterium]|nr:triacylglycerol lipase [Planctomycetaceae bacterium]